MLLKIKSFFSKLNLISFLIIVLIFLLDRYSKFQVLNFFNDTSFYVNDFLNLSLVWNTGIGFGLFSFEKSVYYNATTLLIGLIIFILLYYLLLLVFILFIFLVYNLNLYLEYEYLCCEILKMLTLYNSNLLN